MTVGRFSTVLPSRPVVVQAHEEAFGWVRMARPLGKVRVRLMRNVQFMATLTLGCNSLPGR